jgi:hypothetical protein
MSAPEITMYQRAFSMVWGVRVDIAASPGHIWSILTDAKNFARWNSTVASLQGEIRDGGLLKLRLPGSSSAYTFKVSGFVPNERMVWSGGLVPMFKDVRRFMLLKRPEGTTAFWMTQRFAGLMVPFFKPSLSKFDRVFARYANDLKSAAEQPPASPPSDDSDPVEPEAQDST